MSYLEELLPEFRNGAKIRCKHWSLIKFIRFENGAIVDDDGCNVDLSNETIISDGWELYQEPEPDWDYIIKNKCLCWFWDNAESLEESSYGYLTHYNKYTQCYRDGKKWYKNCRPVRRDEVTFYEDRKDER